MLWKIVYDLIVKDEKMVILERLASNDTDYYVFERVFWNYRGDREALEKYIMPARVKTAKFLRDWAHALESDG